MFLLFFNFLSTYDSSDDIRACKRLLEKAGLEGYQVGTAIPFVEIFHTYTITFEVYIFWEWV